MTCSEPCAQVIEATAKIEGLETWQMRQNGSLGRMECALDESRTASEQRFDRLTGKLDKLTYSVIGLMVSVIGGLAVWILTHPGA